MDFVGLIDGAAFEGSKGDNVAVLLGGGRMLQEFELGITGMKAGERKSLSMRYPDDYHNKALAGRTAEFDVSMKKVEEQRLPDLDDAFCREYGVFEGGVEQLRAKSSDNMHRELGENVRARLKQQLLDKLLEANPVEVPKGLVDAAGPRDADRGRAAHGRQGCLAGTAAGAVRRAGAPARRARHAGRRADQDAWHPDRSGAGRGRLVQMAANYPDPEPMLKAYRQNPDAMRQVENLVLEDQVVDYLLERAKVTDQTTTFKEVMNFGA